MVMAYDRLQAVVGTALVDSSFRRSLLNGSYDVLREFDLSPQEMAAVRMIEADSLQEFASQLHQWMVRQTATRVLAGTPAPAQVPVMA
jgi:hypothetical protein